MGFSFEDIALEEMRLVSGASKKYGEHWTVLQEATEMLWHFPTEMKAEYSVVSPYLAMVRKYSLLAALSAVRLHYAQSFWCLRQVYEAGVVGAHALTQPTRTKEQLQRFSRSPNQALRLAYKWIENSHPAQSDQMKEIKDRLHRWSHASFASGCLNARIEKDHVRIQVFDTDKPRTVRTLLWLNADTIMRFLTLWGAVANPSGGILPEHQFLKKAKSILTILARHSEELKREYAPLGVRAPVQ